MKHSDHPFWFTEKKVEKMFQNDISHYQIACHHLLKPNGARNYHNILYAVVNSCCL